MRIVGYTEILEGQLELPQGYTLEPQVVLEEESGITRRVLLLRRLNESVAWAFDFNEASPTSEEVECRAWDDYRTTARHWY